MTPEQIAEAVMSKWYAGPTLAKHVDLVDLIAPAIRAALRERDAAWAKALHGLDVCGHSMWRYAGDDPKPIYSPKSSMCAWCAPLRALLEEAGSNDR